VSVCLSVRVEHPGCHWTNLVKFCISHVNEIVDTSTFWSKSGTTNGQLTYRLASILIPGLY
jgi:hypothetical protein